MGKLAIYKNHSYYMYKIWMTDRLWVRPSCCECWSVRVAPLQGAAAIVLDLSSNYSSSKAPLCGSPSQPPAPLLPPLSSSAPPIKGSWGRIFGAQPWSRLFAVRLKGPVRTAVKAGLKLCGHISTTINPFSHPTIRPSLAHAQYIYGESLFL